MIAIAGYTFNTRCLNAARVEGDPFDRAPSDAGFAGEIRTSSGLGGSANGKTASDDEPESSLTFPFPSLYRSLVYLQYDNPRTLKELSCLGIR